MFTYTVLCSFLETVMTYRHTHDVGSYRVSGGPSTHVYFRLVLPFEVSLCVL